MNDHRTLRLFLVAADKKSFAQAARELDIPPASVTRAIAGLEAELGMQLFIRTSKQVSLTTEGAVYAAHIRPLLDSLDEARRDTMHAHKVDEGLLRLSAPTWLGETILPKVIAQFSKLYPKMSYELCLSDGLVDIVEDGFDLAIRISLQPSDKYDTWRKICPVPRILVAAPDSPYALMDHPGLLEPEDCLAYNEEGQSENWILSDGGASMIVTASAFSANSGEVLADWASHGLGVALLPRFNVAEHLRSGRLVHVFKAWAPPDLWLTLCYPPCQTLPPRIATFSEHFEKYIRPLAGSL